MQRDIPPPPVDLLQQVMEYQIALSHRCDGALSLHEETLNWQQGQYEAMRTEQQRRDQEHEQLHLEQAARIAELQDQSEALMTDYEQMKHEYDELKRDHDELKHSFSEMSEKVR